MPDGERFDIGVGRRQDALDLAGACVGLFFDAGHGISPL
jgi:hypothetical protein